VRPPGRKEHPSDGPAPQDCRGPGELARNLATWPVFAAADDRSFRGITNRAPHLDAGRLSEMLKPGNLARRLCVCASAAMATDPLTVRIDLDAG